MAEASAENKHIKEQFKPTVFGPSCDSVVMNTSKSKASGVSWVKPAEPSFLQKFKKDVGYKEGPTVDTKRHAMPTPDDDNGSDREDELPQVVVLKDGDLTSEEVKHLKEEAQPKEALEKSTILPRLPDDESPADGKILFKKPAKRLSSDKFQGITASSRKKKCDAVEREAKKEGNSVKKVKNNSLLSFGCDDEEEED
ncbi:uncharacterized protein KIAA1143 homolog [Dunckerocampus dactyliophorus]|uniref:uncharacterized protein KIAA1143 homolog n=1 Tax=Dunckerocampus dactyliophorus TaxID=161453 RepID=UPI0024058FA5|nr:uncharacterized protein KIAA1143 homolog [Dunckerocampus dactyliophorus]